MERVVSVDVAKEVLVVLSYCDDSFVDMIPEQVLKELNVLAADSEKDFYINDNKSLLEQDLSDECKDLLSEMYFMYVLGTEAKRELLNSLNNL